jgi:hypothetical protein
VGVGGLIAFDCRPSYCQKHTRSPRGDDKSVGSTLKAKSEKVVAQSIGRHE